MLPSVHIDENPPHPNIGVATQWNIIGSSTVHSSSSPGSPISQKASSGSQFGDWRRSSIGSPMNQSNQTLGSGSAPAGSKRGCHSNSVYLLLSDLGQSREGQAGNATSVGAKQSDRNIKNLGSPPQQRGVPDGCPLDVDEDHIDGAGSLQIGGLTSSGALTSSTGLVDQHLGVSGGGGALLMKKGWLYLRQRYNGQVEWSRLWFVLRQGSLSQYTDPTAEEKGQSRGSLDTRALRAATELDNADRNYAFALVWFVYPRTRLRSFPN